MEELREKLQKKIDTLKVEEIKMLSGKELDYTGLTIISAKITAYIDAINCTYN